MILLLQKTYLIFLVAAVLIPVFWKRLSTPDIGRLRFLMISEMGCILLAIIGFVAGQAKEASAIHGGFACQTHMKALGRAIVEYTQDWDEHFPPAEHWTTLTSGFVSGGGFNVSAEESMRCPEGATPYSYVFNAALDGKDIKTLKSPKETVLLFESDANGPDKSGGKELLSSKLRHYSKLNFWFAYGFVRAKDSKEIPSLHWKPDDKPSLVDVPAKDD